MPVPMAMAPGTQAPTAARRRPTPVRRRMQLRAAADAVLALLLVAASTLLSPDPYTQLRLAIVAAAFAIMAFLIRRNQDLAAIRADHRSRDAEFEGRGISIAQWHAGRPLAPWRERGAGTSDCDS